MDLSPERYLKLLIPIEPASSPPQTEPELVRRDAVFTIGSWNAMTRLWIFMQVIKSRKFHRVNVEEMSAAARLVCKSSISTMIDLISYNDSVEVKYLRPVMKIANQNLFHPRACTLRMTHTTQSDGMRNNLVTDTCLFIGSTFQKL